MTAGPDFSVTFDDAEVQARLDALAASGNDLTPAMAEISRHLVNQIGFRFRSESGPDGVPWIRSQRVLGLTGTKLGPNKQSGQTLTDKGDLRRSMREDYGRDYAAAGPEASGGAAVYAAVHQFGFSGPVAVPFHTRRVTSRFGKTLDEPAVDFVSSHIRQMRLPARQYLGFTADDPAVIIEILEDHMAEALGVAS